MAERRRQYRRRQNEAEGYAIYKRSLVFSATTYMPKKACLQPTSMPRCHSHAAAVSERVPSSSSFCVSLEMMFYLHSREKTAATQQDSSRQIQAQLLMVNALSIRERCIYERKSYGNT
jgi:hypothetical protein